MNSDALAIFMGGSLIMLLIVAILYLLPTFIAMKRGHKSTMIIAIINIFLGWSVIFWVIALIWSLSNPNGATITVNVNNTKSE